MRIAYIAPYHGTTILERRPIIRNRSLSNKVKIEQIATLLKSKSHDVEILSQGEASEHTFKFYRSFDESDRFAHDIPIHYSSMLTVPRLTGFWSSLSVLGRLKARHRVNPYDLVIVVNLKPPQIACAHHALKRMRIPVVLEYEDDAFSSVHGEKRNWLISQFHNRKYRKVLSSVSACVGVSPYLLSQVPHSIPKLLLPGIVSADLSSAAEDITCQKVNRVLFSGTHVASNGIAELIQAWNWLRLPDWELHITGCGALTESLKLQAASVPGIVFHGFVSREALLGLMCSARVCVNPHVVADAPGSVFAFKLIEYLATGAHVISTPMGEFDAETAKGITYMPDNRPEIIARTLSSVIQARKWEQDVGERVRQVYGPKSVAESLDRFLRCVAERRKPWGSHLAAAVSV
jgi:glycosyltransferase involved in cell wall biosynthesis